MKSATLALIILTIFDLISSNVLSSRHEKPSHEDSLHYCTERTGLEEEDIVEFYKKNDE